MVMLVVVLAVEAFARGYFVAFYLRLVIVFAIANLLIAYVQNWQFATMCLFVALAIIVLVVNIRDARRG